MIGITPGDAAAAQRRLFNTTIAVYDGDAFDHLVQEEIPARFVPLSQQPGATGSDRAELAAIRELWWTPTYSLPPYVQIRDAAGARWNPDLATVTTIGEGTALYQRCDVRRAQ